jgi:cytosine deaminase
MASYNDAYAYKLIRIIRASGMFIIANPLDNIVLQGRFDTYPKRRGMTRVRELLAAGVPVGAGHDSIMDPWYPWGTANPLFVASMLAHIAQMTGSEDLPAVLATVGDYAAKIMRVENYAVAVGAPANFVVYSTGAIADLIRLMPRPRWVVAAGRMLAETAPQESRIAWPRAE